MSQFNPNVILFRYRSLISGAFLLAIAYFVLFVGLSVPGLAMFVAWEPDTKLVVLPTIEDQYQTYVQPGDELLAIDGRVPRRGQLIFTPPLKDQYTLSIKRDGQVLTVTIPTDDSQFFDVWRLTQAVLAFLIWFIGYLTVRYARSGENAPIVAGFGFQLIAIGLVSPGPSQFGAPGAWLVGNVLINYFPYIMLYLSLLPRFVPLGKRMQQLLAGSFVLSSLLALIGLWEHLFLFPEQSLMDVAGVRSAALLTIITGISLVTAVAILLVRLLNAPKTSYERQQLVLLFVFLLLAVVPLLVFVIAPAPTQFYAPLPFVFSFLLFVPAGYFFVLHRQGKVELDGVFSNAVVVGMLVLALGLAYSTGIYLFNILFDMNMNSINQGAFTVTLLGVTIILQRPVQAYVDLLVYGRQPPIDAAIHAARTQLAAQPESVTVDATLNRLAPLFQADKTAVLVQVKGAGGERCQWLAGSTAPFEVEMQSEWQQICFRMQNPASLKGLPMWVEISLPLMARGEMLGLLLFSRPRHGYFNHRQKKWLEEIADMLAFGLLVISLVSEMDTSTRELLQRQERARFQFATELHNEPLQALMGLILSIQTGRFEEAEDALPTLNEINVQLRRLLKGLRPINPVEKVPQIVQHAREVFEAKNRDIAVNLQLDVDVTAGISEEKKQICFYILTEALNNVAKHAQATQVNIMVQHVQGLLVLIISDNGTGPGSAQLPLTELLRRNHEGIAMMHRWTSIANGRLQISENSMGGTTIQLEMPVGTALETGTIDGILF